jgi:hypothetical protein
VAKSLTKESPKNTKSYLSLSPDFLDLGSPNPPLTNQKLLLRNQLQLLENVTDAVNQDILLKTTNSPKKLIILTLMILSLVRLSIFSSKIVILTSLIMNLNNNSINLRIMISNLPQPPNPIRKTPKVNLKSMLSPKNKISFLKLSVISRILTKRNNILNNSKKL